MFGLNLNIEKIIDQKGHRIGACVPFAQLIDRFVSQEESVEARLDFKSKIRSILSSIQSSKAEKADGFEELKAFYARNQQAIDYHGLSFLLEPDTPTHPELSKSPEYMEVLAKLTDRIASEALRESGPYVVGINGVDTSGKTELTKELEASLREAGVQVSIVHLDTFTNPNAKRHSGTDVIDNYYNHTFDYEGLRRHILQPITAGQLPKIVLSHVDPKSDTLMIEHAYDVAAAPSVVIVEGVFLFRPELQDYFKLKIFVDIPLAAIRERVMIRDVPRFGFSALAKFLNKYIPTQEQYLQTVRPNAIADIIVDNSDWTAPTITKR